MIRFQITLPELYHHRLKSWAYLKGTNRATLAGNILQSRIEANWEDVNKSLDALAEHKGITREELNKEIEADGN